jgi:hypothetical protein
LLNMYKVSVWDDEKVLKTAVMVAQLWMKLMPLNCLFKWLENKSYIYIYVYIYVYIYIYIYIHICYYEFKKNGKGIHCTDLSLMNS